jgi:hypothetical protein
MDSLNMVSLKFRQVFVNDDGVVNATIDIYCRQFSIYKMSWLPVACSLDLVMHGL